MQRRRIDSGGIGISVVDWRAAADGPVLLCMHGNTGNARAYDPFVAAFGADFGVVAPDLRGRGESDKPDGPYGAAAHAGDMIAVLNALGVERAAVAGWSLGAKIALYLAAHYPEQIERVILLDPGLVAARPAAAASLGRIGARLGNSYPDLDAARASLQALPMFSGEWDEHAEAFLIGELEAAPDGGLRHRVPPRVIAAERAAPDAPTAQLLPEVSCPTLIVRAPEPLYEDGDQLFTAEEGERAARILPRGRMVDAPGTNHFSIVLGQPTATIAALWAFLVEPVE